MPRPYGDMAVRHIDTTLYPKSGTGLPVPLLDANEPEVVV